MRDQGARAGAESGLAGTSSAGRKADGGSSERHRAVEWATNAAYPAAPALVIDLPRLKEGVGKSRSGTGEDHS